MQRTGYVLKPMSRRGEAPALPSVKRTLNVEVIQGHHLPRPDRTTSGSVVTPYVKITLHGTGLNGEDSNRGPLNPKL